MLSDSRILVAIRSARSVGLGTPVIIMTALQSDRIPAQAEVLGRQTAVLRKPFMLNELASLSRPQFVSRVR